MGPTPSDMCDTHANPHLIPNQPQWNCLSGNMRCVTHMRLHISFQISLNGSVCWQTWDVWHTRDPKFHAFIYFWRKCWLAYMKGVYITTQQRTTCLGTHDMTNHSLPANGQGCYNGRVFQAMDGNAMRKLGAFLDAKKKIKKLPRRPRNVKLVWDIFEKGFYGMTKPHSKLFYIRGTKYLRVMEPEIHSSLCTDRTTLAVRSSDSQERIGRGVT